MANNYYQMTGTLMLTEITPVIDALFGIYSVSPYDEGTAYIKQDEGDWTNGDSLVEHIMAVMELPECDSLTECIQAMAEKLGKTEGLAAVLGNYDTADMESGVPLDFLFNLAVALDDGHGLTEVSVAGAFTCDKMRLGEFGGDGEFVGREFSMYSGSYLVSNYGPATNEALERGDLDGASKNIAAIALQLLNGITDTQARLAITKKVAAELAALPACEGNVSL